MVFALKIYGAFLKLSMHRASQPAHLRSSSILGWITLDIVTGCTFNQSGVAFHVRKKKKTRDQRIDFWVKSHNHDHVGEIKRDGNRGTHNAK